MRGTAATELLRAGCSLQEIAVTMGWGLRHAGNIIERYAALAALEPTAEPDIDTGVTVNPVQPEPGTGSTLNGVRGSGWTPNHPKTILKPPTRRREAAEGVEDLEAEKILAAYPEDRIRDGRTSLRLIAAALKAGVEPDDLKQAIKAYAKESEGYTRSKVCFSDNWFKMRRWEKGLAQIQADREKAREAEAKGRASLAEWIHERHPLCRHITNRQIEDLIASKLVTPEQVRAAGLQA
ncbi:hypothetical protein SAMN04488527_110100 [Aliiroseovarius crassostreae]|uniref:hypothetical protein n=2 Tax=Aliiroseovarius crassostreae TaxID=154981 RepID=UPI0008E95C89|nr:hypothetical protein [Aliiroseovarius crassostreae]SFU68152.1 hypothetical protein SAMN04488527_110100 [Aliiroseovarius crassostreae]